ncbi:N-6 DNA methylase [Endozoicomonas sp. YOMI1]|uniref:N-6 DNA methylase n=1 Tax=Endozoicomonas sp. YOMI1 TaxID=2828739 RepID=UPI0021490A11|nr:N-6 DNA methylase [Endozoicomonas sp. YOMI1]
MRAQDIEHIHEAHSAAFHNGVEEEKYCRLVPMGEIAGNDYNLNIARYIDTSVAEVQVDIAAVLAELEVINGKLEAVAGELNDYLRELGLMKVASAEEEVA